MSRGKLFVISGASGVGKSTVLKKVLDTRPDIRFSVSATTRAPRKGEIDGVHYYFVTKEQFQSMIENNAFVEYDAHMENCYGTPRAQLEEKLRQGDVILDIEPVGALNVRAQCPEAVLIFIAPPSYAELERRLCNRGDTDQDQIAVRLARAKWEMEQSQKYDYIVTNEQVDTCAAEILKIISK